MSESILTMIDLLVICCKPNKTFLIKVSLKSVSEWKVNMFHSNFLLMSANLLNFIPICESIWWMKINITGTRYNFPIIKDLYIIILNIRREQYNHS